MNALQLNKAHVDACDRLVKLTKNSPALSIRFRTRGSMGSDGEAGAGGASSSGGGRKRSRSPEQEKGGKAGKDKRRDDDDRCVGCGVVCVL